MEQKKFSARELAGFVIMTILTIVGLFTEIYMSLKYYTGYQLLIYIIPYIILYALLVYYVAFGYKKPHGDLLRIIFILFALACLSTIAPGLEACFDIITINNFVIISTTLMSFSIMITAYIAGRLDKIIKNRALLALNSIVLVAVGVFWIMQYKSLPAMTFMQKVWNFNLCILWADIVVAYILRYREHKEAGLIDKE